MGDMDFARNDNKYKPYNAPAWLVELAKQNAANGSLDALKAKLQQVKDDARDTDRRGQTVSPAQGTEVNGLACDSVAVTARVELMEPTEPMDTTVPMEISDGDINLDSPDSSDNHSLSENVALVSDARKRQERRQEERRTKKKAIRAQQVKESGHVKEAVSKRKGSLTVTKESELKALSLAAESSRAGAAREAVVNTSTTTPNTISSLLAPGDSSDRYPVRPLPAWYTSINENGFEMKQLARKKPQDLAALDSLKGYIISCQGERRPAMRDKLYENLRNEVHKAEIVLTVNKFILKKARIFSPDTGLSAIFKKDAIFPPDLKADSFQLYNRWYYQDFDQDILRGIITAKGKDRNGDRIDPRYREKHPASAKYYGEGNLVLGQWWPTQLCTVRDGAHGAAQGGIFGEKDRGAYSIVLSGGGYHDVDNGTSIEYSGTESKDSTPTENTTHLITSINLQNPIRVIRSHQLVKSNPYRPSVGLRYDGLYKAKSFEVVDKNKAMCRFRLERCEGQERIRCEGDAARRPTYYEEMELERLRRKKNW
ncbi:hypothetical protein NX059_009472 [Plenodomus lindquistii]|nr:hypothetical protein NX059_009472 [Plenodomus lindquistii]